MLTRWNFGAFDGGIDGDEKQDGSQPRNCCGIEFADRTLCRPGAHLFLLSFWPADGSGIYIAPRSWRSLDPAHTGPLPKCLPQLLFKRWQFDLQKSPPSVAARATPRLEPDAGLFVEERR